MQWGMLALDTRILQEGVRTEAVVTGRVLEVDDDGDTVYEVLYAFSLHTGERAENITTSDRETFEDRYGTRYEGETEWGPRQLVEEWAEGDGGQVRYGHRDWSESIWLGQGVLMFYR